MRSKKARIALSVVARVSDTFRQYRPGHWRNHLVPHVALFGTRWMLPVHGRGSVLVRQRCDTPRTSDFLDTSYLLIIGQTKNHESTESNSPGAARISHRTD